MNNNMHLYTCNFTGRVGSSFERRQATRAAARARLPAARHGRGRRRVDREALGTRIRTTRVRATTAGAGGSDSRILARKAHAFRVQRQLIDLELVELRALSDIRRHNIKG